MKAQEFLDSKGLFNTNKLVNSFDEIFTLTELLEEYSVMREQLSCGCDHHDSVGKIDGLCKECWDSK